MENEGRIQYKRLSSKKILYDIDSFSDDEQCSSSLNTKHIIYARVSTSGQKNDLCKQIEIIKKYVLSNGHKVDEIYSDIASGMNDSRKQFEKMLESIFRREVNTVYISFKDRLSRFDFNYFKTIFSFFGTQIVVFDDNEETNKTYQQELMEDLLAIIHSYSMKLYTHRKKKLKEIEKIIKSEEEN